MARSLSLKVFLTLFFAFFLQIASAAPVGCTSLSNTPGPCAAEIDTRDLLKRYVGKPRGKEGKGGPDKSDYPSDDEIRKAYTKPSGPHVFYSGIGANTDKPYKFSQEVKGVLIRNAFPKKYLNREKRSTQWYNNFLDRASAVFAELTPGDNAYLVSNYDKDTISKDSIWARLERPTLEGKASIKSITLVDVDDFKKQKKIYEKK